MNTFDYIPSSDMSSISSMAYKTIASYWKVVSTRIEKHRQTCFVDKPIHAWSQELWTQSCIYPWWHHQMETFAGNSPVTGKFPSQRPVTRSFDFFFDLHLNKRVSKQSWGWWFEMPFGCFHVFCPGFIPVHFDHIIYAYLTGNQKHCSNHGEHKSSIRQQTINNITKTRECKTNPWEYLRDMAWIIIRGRRSTGIN